MRFSLLLQMNIDDSIYNYTKWSRSGVPKEALDLYILGNVLRSGHGQALPRQAAFKIGIPDHITGYAVDMVCRFGKSEEIAWTVAFLLSPIASSYITSEVLRVHGAHYT